MAFSLEGRMLFVDEQCRYVFDESELSRGFSRYLTQFYGLLIKSLLVHSRRWALTLIVLFLPIAYSVLSNVMSHSENASGFFNMHVSALNPQTIWYRTDPSIDPYFQASLPLESSGVVAEQRQEQILEMNKRIWGSFTRKTLFDQ